MDMRKQHSNYQYLQDIQLIMPTVIILLFTIIIMITVIPYAFSSVLRQMEAVRSLEAAGKIISALVMSVCLSVFQFVI